jgi:hypothetical protein
MNVARAEIFSFLRGLCNLPRMKVDLWAEEGKLSISLNNSHNNTAHYLSEGAHAGNVLITLQHHIPPADPLTVNSSELLFDEYQSYN